MPSRSFLPGLKLAGALLAIGSLAIMFGCGPSNLPQRDFEPVGCVYGLIRIQDIAGTIDNTTGISGTAIAQDTDGKRWAAPIYGIFTAGTSAPVVGTHVSAEAWSGLTTVVSSFTAGTQYAVYEFAGSNALPATNVSYSISLNRVMNAPALPTEAETINPTTTSITVDEGTRGLSGMLPIFELVRQ